MSKKSRIREIVEDVKHVAAMLGKFPNRGEYLHHGKFKWNDIYSQDTFGGWTHLVRACGAERVMDYVDEGAGPKVLFLDIETFPIVAMVWGPWDQNIAINQVVDDWSIASFAGMWLHSEEVIYWDQRGAKNVRDDKLLLEEAWKILDEADVIITQNGKRFDAKKLFARFIMHGMKPPSPFKHIDIRQIAKKWFGFTYNSLEYFCKILKVKHQKLKHEKFIGMDLWTECLKGNLAAWEEMKKYNIQDVFALKEVWEKLRAWDNGGVNFNLYFGSRMTRCQCGGEYVKHGFYFSAAGKFQRYACKTCGSWARGRENLMSKRKKESVLHQAK